VFGHVCSGTRDLEDLAGLDACDLCTGEIAFTGRAALRSMGDDHVGLRYLRQVMAL